MNVTVTLRGELAAGQVQTIEEEIADEATLDDLMAALLVPSGQVQVALVNGIPAARTTRLHEGDQVTLGAVEDQMPLI